MRKMSVLGVLTTDTPSAKFCKQQGGGVSVKKFFLKEILEKKFPALRAGRKTRGGICS